MKKKFLGIFAFMVMLLMCSGSALATDAEPQQNDVYIQSSIESIIVLFYENKDMGANNDLGKMIDVDVSKYLADKVDVERHVTNLYETGKENYAVQVRMLDKKAVSNQLQFTFQIITTYNYVNTKDFDTEISEEVIVTYDRDKALITDVYSPLNYYDIAIRGENSKALADISKEDRKTALDRLMKDIHKEYTGNTKETALLNDVMDEPFATKGSSLNYSNAVLYARNGVFAPCPLLGKDKGYFSGKNPEDTISVLNPMIVFCRLRT